MKKIIFLFLICSSLTVYSQEKYFIYFGDKGIPEKSFSKSSAQFSKAVSELSQKSIERRKKVMGERFVTYEDIPVYEPYVEKIENLGVTVKNKLKWFNAVTAYLDQAQLSKIKQFSFVDKIEPVKSTKFKKEEINKPVSENIKSGALNKSDGAINYGPSATQLSLSDVPIAHKNNITGKDIVIGLLDTGFNWETNPALMSKHVVAEHDFIFNDDVTANESADALDQDSHGTSVFSIIGGYWEGNVVGPAFGASYILSKTEDVRSESKIEEDNYAAALEWMEGLGVDLTSSSLGYSEFDNSSTNYSYADMNGETAICTKAAELAFSRGVLTVTSAGNEGDASWYYITAPADGKNTIAVGAVTSGNLLTSFSSRGPSSDGRIKPDITAQGSFVYNANRNGALSSGAGTSFSAPIAAGIAALMLSVYPDLDNVQLRKLIQQSGDRYENPDNQYGYGLLSAKRLLNNPVVIADSSVTEIRKIILDDNGVKPESVKLYLGTGGNFTESQLNYDGSKIFSFLPPVIKQGDSLRFYFGYFDSLNNAKTSPENGYYTYVNSDPQIVGVLSGERSGGVITDYSLSQNYPNPFNPETKIKYEIPGNGFVKLEVFDILGRKIKTLVNEYQNAGQYRDVVFNGSGFASGVYLLVLNVNDYTAVHKMMLLK